MEGFILDMNSLKDLRAKGDQAYKQRHLLQAKSLYTLCINQCISMRKEGLGTHQLDMELLLAVSNRAQVHLHLKLFDRARTDATHALSLDPLHVNSILCKAEALYGLRDPEAAVSCLEDARSQNAQDISEFQKEAIALHIKYGRTHISEDMKQKLIHRADGYINTEIDPKSLGSGRNGCPLVTPMCANNKACLNTAARHGNAQACKACYLVSYCSSKCRKAHAKEHRKMCTVVPASWRPSKTQDHEEPASSIFLWGNVPAISLLSLKQPLPTSLKLCFAASGDLRDMLTTLSQIPKGYSGTVHVVLNDHSNHVLMRNFIILEMLRCYGKDAIDCVIAIWYSDAMTPAQSRACLATGWDALKRCGFLERSAATIAACRSWSAQCGPPLVAAFKGGLSTLSVNTNDRDWTLLMKDLETCDKPPSTIKDARLRRSASSYADLIKNINGFFRVAWCQFHYQNGLMLPFSSAMDPHFTAANMFLLDPVDDAVWLQVSTADPLCGWHYKDMEHEMLTLGVPHEDLYGALFFHLRTTLSSFIDVLERTCVEIELFDGNASLLAENFKKSSDTRRRFNVVSTSNIADHNFVGLKKVLSDWGPLLASNGTLITMQMQWFQETMLNNMSPAKIYKEMERGMKETLGEEMEADAEEMVQAMIQRLQDPYEQTERVLIIHSKAVMIAMCTRTDIGYAKHLTNGGIQQVAKEVGLKMQSKRKYVPARIGVSLEAPSSATPVNYISSSGEFKLALLRKSTFMERYVEWTTLSF